VEPQNSEPNDPNVSELAEEQSPEMQSGPAVERDQLLAEKAELQDRLLRARAEFDNFRRRAERERSDFLQFASMDLVRELLPVLDDFERALKAPATDSDYVKGVTLIYNRFFDTLKKMGLQRGYLFKGKLLRPAWVQVSVKP
jgi:molecular chaperone GrpE